MQGFSEAYDERAEEIEKNFSYDGYQIVRRELFAHLREPALTIRKDSIAFNMACIEGLEDTVYINVMINEDEKRVAIRRCEENDLESVRWCVAKGEKRKSRNVKGDFSKAIYKIMQWSEGCRYKVLGHKICHEGVTLYVFELERYEKFKERRKRTPQEKLERAKVMTPEEIAEEDRRERKESMIPFSPYDAENTFGLPVDQYSSEIRLDSLNGYAKMDAPSFKKGKSQNDGITSSLSSERQGDAAYENNGNATPEAHPYAADEPVGSADRGYLTSADNDNTGYAAMESSGSTAEGRRTYE